MKQVVADDMITDSPIIVKKTKKRVLQEEDTFSDADEAFESPRGVSSAKKPKMSENEKIKDFDDLFKRLTDDNNVKIGSLQISIVESNQILQKQIADVQTDVTEVRNKQRAQEAQVQSMNTNIVKLNNNQDEVFKRLESLEKGDRSNTHHIKNNGKLTPWEEKLQDLVANTFKLIAIFECPMDQDATYIRNQADLMKLETAMKDEIKNGAIKLIPDKRPANKRRATDTKLYHFTTSGLQARQAILIAAKDRPGGMRWDAVVPHPFKVGYNAQKAIVWQIRNGLGLSAQLEIHGHTSVIFINEKDSSEDRRVFSTFVPVEKTAKKLSPLSMETNVDTDQDEDKPIIKYSENKAYVEELSSIIFWTKFATVLEGPFRAAELETLMGEDYAKILQSKTVHAKHHSRIWFHNKEDASEMYHKYINHPKRQKSWDWSIFLQNKCKLE